MLSSIENLIGSEHNDTLTGNSGDNIIEGGDGADQIDGGDGSDTASYASSDAAVTVDLSNDTASGGHATGDNLDNIQNLIGSAHNDTLTGDEGDNIIEGGAGADHINGGYGKNIASYASSDAAVQLTERRYSIRWRC